MQHSEGEDAARFSVLCFRRADKTANSIFYADKGVLWSLILMWCVIIYAYVLHKIIVRAVGNAHR